MANEYSSKFELFREFFARNEELDIDKLREEEHGERGGGRGKGYKVEGTAKERGGETESIVERGE